MQTIYYYSPCLHFQTEKYPLITSHDGDGVKLLGMDGPTTHTYRVQLRSVDFDWLVRVW